MNDFTKAELELIYDCVENDFLYSNWSRVMYEPFLAKINSMIDNYCDHKNTQMDCDGGISLVCSDCGSTMVDI